MHDWENWPRITRKTCGLRARAEITSHFAAGRSPQGRGGEGRVSASLPLLDDVRPRLRRGASHLPARRSRQNVNLFLREPLARGERLLRTPGTHAYVTNAPRRGRGEILQPLPGCISLFLFYPGVRFAHPRLISLRPAGAQFARLKSCPPVFS